MTSSGLNWSTLGFQMYQCQTIPWNFWQSYESFLRNSHQRSGFQWYVEFSGSPLLLPDNPFDYTGKLTREISGNYTCRVYAKGTSSLYSAPPPEDIILVASAEGTTPNGVMQTIDESLTPRIEEVKQTVWNTIAKNEEARWLAKQVAAQAAAQAAAATNAAQAAALQAEADRLAEINARDAQTLAAMQAAAAKTGAAATVKSFLNLYYPLPADWAYEIEQTEKPTVHPPWVRLEASAKYFGSGKTRGPVPAGYVELNPQLYGFDPVAIWNKIAADFPNASTARPAFMHTVSDCLDADALATPSYFDDTLGPAPVMLETATPDAEVPNPNQVWSSSGVAPWDAQPDVIQPYPVPPVTGVLYGEGWTGTIKTTSGGSTVPDGFLDWLNLKVPDPAQVKMIRFDPSLLEPYLKIFENERVIAPKDPLGRESVPPLPLPELYDNPVKPVPPEPAFDGNGVIPTKEGQGSTYVQKPPTNIATLGATGTAAAGSAGYQDNVGLMLAGALTDFYTMLAQTYQETLAAVAAIPQARADLNELIDIDKPSKVEQYLRDFDAARYNAPPPPPPPPKDEKTEAPKDNKMFWIGLGLLAAVYFVSTRKAEANAN